MKKTLLFTLCLLISGLFAFSQSLSLSDSAGAVANNSTVIKTGVHNGNIIAAYLNVKNVGTKSLNVLCKKVEVDLVSGAIVTFCWADNCYPPTTFVSPSAATIAPGETNTGFSGDYDPQGNVGESLIRYVWFDQDNTSDSVCVNVLFKAWPLGVETAGKTLATAWPNPASNMVNFTYNVQEASNATLIIRDLLGSVVKSIDLSNTSGKSSLSVTDLASGVYFYSILLNGTPAVTKKLVVRH